jgi:uncharacterized membrane protein YcaP (DUF421 family)
VKHRPAGYPAGVVHWASLFRPTGQVPELIIRGTVVYLALYFMLRVVLKRESGSTGVTDLLVIVLLADAAQNAMSGGYTNIADGIILVGTIIFWSWMLNLIAYLSPRAARIIRPRPLLLVRNGQVLSRNMRRELLTDDELMANLREQGVRRLDEVAAVYMEADGRLSVTTRGRPKRSGPGKRVP